MTFSNRLLQRAAPIWAGYHTHPFVKGIGDGTLNVDRFRYFLIQDYLYLFEYAKVFALGVIKAKEPAHMRRFAKSVEATLNGEMTIHRAYMKRLGISEREAESARPALANVSYTNYMLSVGFSGDVAAIAAAILACSWSYAEIGLRLNAIPGAAQHPLYGEWISGYCSAAYQEENDALMTLMIRWRKDALKKIWPISKRCSSVAAATRRSFGIWHGIWRISDAFAARGDLSIPEGAGFDRSRAVF